MCVSFSENQNPGEVNGVLEAGGPGPVKVSAPTYTQPGMLEWYTSDA